MFKIHPTNPNDIYTSIPHIEPNYRSGHFSTLKIDPNERNYHDWYCLMPRLGSPLLACTVLVHYAVDMNKTTLSTTLKTTLFDTGYLTQQQ